MYSIVYTGRIIHDIYSQILFQIVSIDLIPPRGCAFVCMNRRMDANRFVVLLLSRIVFTSFIQFMKPFIFVDQWTLMIYIFRALKNLHKFRLHGKQITLAWAPGKGMKDKMWKDYWDLDLGCSYIPLDKVTSQVSLKLLKFNT